MIPGGSCKSWGTGVHKISSLRVTGALEHGAHWLERNKGGVQEWHSLKKEKKKERKKRILKMELNREKKIKQGKTVATGFSKPEGEQKDGSHQPLSLETIPEVPFPSKQCFKIRKCIFSHNVCVLFKGLLLCYVME